MSSNNDMENIPAIRRWRRSIILIAGCVFSATLAVGLIWAVDAWQTLARKTVNLNGRTYQLKLYRQHGSVHLNVSENRGWFGGRGKQSSTLFFEEASNINTDSAIVDAGNGVVRVIAGPEEKKVDLKAF